MSVWAYAAGPAHKGKAQPPPVTVAPVPAKDAPPAAAAAPAVSAPTPAAPVAAPAPIPWRLTKGGNVSAWNVTDVAKVFADASRLGLDTITVPVRVNMSAANSADANVDPISLAFAKQVVAYSKSYQYIIEPYPWIDNGNVPETDLNPDDKAAWFAAYEASVVALAREFPTAWGIYVASNLVKIEDQSASWMALVKAVRAAFPGKIIYRTQWWATAAWDANTAKVYTAKLSNPVFGAVDVIGIAAYFELTDVAAPSKDQIKAALRSTTIYARKQDVYAEVMALQAKWQKPIFLGELSCPAVDFGAQSPWDPAASDVENQDIQKNMIHAYVETFVGDPAKFLGFSVFTIGHPTPTPYDLAPSAAAYMLTIQTKKP